MVKGYRGRCSSYTFRMDGMRRGVSRGCRRTRAGSVSTGRTAGNDRLNGVQSWRGQSVRSRSNDRMRRGSYDGVSRSSRRSRKRERMRRGQRNRH
jgi:hypothetical protein